MDRLKELINRYQQSVDYLAENWNITTRHMEMGELREHKEHCQIEDDTLTYLKELQHYKDLEEQGRLIELPCKVGDTVYVVDTDYTDIYDISSQYYFIIECEFELYMITGLGIWVFLTKEEAESKLKKLKEGVE